ncbi:DegT/DnrJ/EryC1/StrS family aminotransferase [Fundidesulfovibrio agrisoli]|uniref:DegT/DnrJ/EryC1/StrS family aminotransferase n=1 Tax=Fundidesulfovibrio agrisoli TaxID=2922717 RepID=UPI001FAD0961|nr:DegT/DnrJ/EryC1/StrS aminotransferase family protein [Fundidesulfovibrio agrisoli]
MIEFSGLKAQRERIRPRLEAAISAVLDHGKFIMGPEVRELEERLAAFAGVKHCLGCSSGTDALLLALMALGVGPGDAVITTPFTFVASAEAIALAGATPVFADVDPATRNLDPARLREALDGLGRDPRGLRPRAAIAVDLFGLPCDYPALSAVLEGSGVHLIEDAAQSFGASLGGVRAGAFGHVAATSFFPAKPLGCFGDGGAVFTADPALAESVESLRVHGKGGHKYDNARIGLNARLDTLQAAILLVKLDIFEEELALREAVAARYARNLGDVAGLGLPPEVPGARSAWAQYTVELPQTHDRDSVAQTLQARGVPTAVYYPRPLHLQPAFANLGYKPGDFPVAEGLCERVLSLPMHPYLRDDEVDFVSEVLREALEA